MYWQIWWSSMRYSEIVILAKNRFSIVKRPQTFNRMINRGPSSCDDNKNDTKCYRNNVNFILHILNLNATRRANVQRVSLPFTNYRVITNMVIRCFSLAIFVCCLPICVCLCLSLFSFSLPSAKWTILRRRICHFPLVNIKRQKRKAFKKAEILIKVFRMTSNFRVNGISNYTVTQNFYFTNFEFFFYYLSIVLSIESIVGNLTIWDNFSMITYLLHCLNTFFRQTILFFYLFQFKFSKRYGSIYAWFLV